MRWPAVPIAMAFCAASALAEERQDQYGDPLPAGARGRVGTVRFQHGREVSGLAYASGGKDLVSLGGDRAISVWDAASGRERLRIGGSPRRMAVSADGERVAVSFGRGPVKLWMLGDGQPLPSIGPPDLEADRLAFTPDSQQLVTVASSWNNRIRLWNLASGAEISRFPEVREPIFALAFSRDGKHLATARETSTIRLWDALAGKQRHLIEGEGGWAFCIAFDPRGQTLATADSHRAIHLWSVAGGQEIRTLTGHAEMVNNVAFLPSGNELVSDANDGTVRVWEAATGAELRRIEVSGSETYNHAFAVSPDGGTLAVTKSLKLIDLATGLERSPRPPGGGPLAWSRADGALLTGDTALVLCEAAGRVLQRFEIPKFQTVRACGFADGGQTIACVTSGGQLLRWRRATGELLGDAQLVMGAALAFSPDGKLLALGGAADATALVEVATAQPLQKLALPLDRLARPASGGVSAVAWAGGQLLAATADVLKLSPGGLRLWDAASGRNIQELAVAEQTLAKPITALAFAPDGQTVAAATADRRLRLWETETGQELYCGPAGSEIEALAFSPDGQWLAIAADRAVSLAATFDPERPLQRLAGHRDAIRAVAFSPDGRALASSSDDGTTLIWDAGPLTFAAQPAPSPAEAEQLWRDVASADAPVAFAALRRLLAAGDSALPQLAATLQPPSRRAEPEQIARWIVQLDAEEFQTREAAGEELRKLGRWARPALETAAAGEGSSEVKQRVKRLLAQLALQPLSPAEIRTLRAIRLLEYWNTAGSRRVLATIAGWDESAVETTFAKEALKRLGKAAP